MPLVKATQPLPERPVIVMIHGDPGSGKTTIGNTCNEPILIDGDKGVDRSILRKDTLIPDSWDEILAAETQGMLDSYKTLVLDTPKALLDDFMKKYVIDKDYKLKTNKMGMYGAIGDEFSLFVANRQKAKADIFIVCHSKKDEDKQLMGPDVTGGSSQLLLRKADQVGYLTIRNGQRVIIFEPNDFSIGKNTARLPDMYVPPVGSPELETFGAKIIELTRKAIVSMNEEQEAALATTKELQDQIAAAPAPYDLNGILAKVNTLPDFLKNPLKLKIKEKADTSGWVFDTVAKAFKVADKPTNGTPAPDAQQATPAAQPEGTATPQAETQPAPEHKPEQKETPVVEKSESEIAFEKMMEGENLVDVVPKGVERFKTEYKTKETLIAVLNEAKKTTQVSDLCMSNGKLVEDHGLFQLFVEKRSQLNGELAIS